MNRHGFLIDMDGVIYRERQLIPGADRFIGSLIDRGIPFAFLMLRTVAGETILFQQRQHIVRESDFSRRRCGQCAYAVVSNRTASAAVGQGTNNRQR